MVMPIPAPSPAESSSPLTSVEVRRFDAWMAQEWRAPAHRGDHGCGRCPLGAPARWVRSDRQRSPSRPCCLTRRPAAEVALRGLERSTRVTEPVICDQAGQKARSRTAPSTTRSASEQAGRTTAGRPSGVALEACPAAGGALIGSTSSKRSPPGGKNCPASAGSILGWQEREGRPGPPMGLGGAAGSTGPRLGSITSRAMAAPRLLYVVLAFDPYTQQWLRPDVLRGPSRSLALEGARLVGLRSGSGVRLALSTWGSSGRRLKKRRRAARDAGGDPGSTARVWASLAVALCGSALGLSWPSAWYVSSIGSDATTPGIMTE